MNDDELKKIDNDFKISASRYHHTPVLLTEAIESLQIKPDGIYVDCTFGGGGHSKGILDRLGAKGKLVAFDQDADAQQNVPKDERILFVPQNFRYLQRFLRLYKVPAVDGIIADLGVSSYMFDVGERGFSTRFDGPLDMRMDVRQPSTAADILLSYKQDELHKMFEQFGEVTNSRTLAKYIVQHRSLQAVATVQSFKTLLHPLVRGNPNKYFAQVFQALRIAVNDEINALKDLLTQVPDVLKTNGRIAVITFHSIEDRIVKTFFKLGSFLEANNHPFQTDVKTYPFHIITKKPIIPQADEIKRNPRARSAKLRVAEKK